MGDALLSIPCAIEIRTAEVFTPSTKVHRPVCSCGWTTWDRPFVLLWFQDRRSAITAGEKHAPSEQAA